MKADGELSTSKSKKLKKATELKQKQSEKNKAPKRVQTVSNATTEKFSVANSNTSSHLLLFQ